jgi:hypothetical protein
MKNKDRLVYVTAGVALLLLIGVTCYIFAYLFTGLYWNCGDMQGRSEAEVLSKMDRYTKPPYVLVRDSHPSTYGWMGRLPYASSLTFAHNNRHYECKVLLNDDGNVVDTQPFFD